MGSKLEGGWVEEDGGEEEDDEGREGKIGEEKREGGRSGVNII
jgi:hypothetical protein